MNMKFEKWEKKHMGESLKGKTIGGGNCKGSPRKRCKTRMVGKSIS
jgi:hypothetical protein